MWGLVTTVAVHPESLLGVVSDGTATSWCPHCVVPAWLAGSRCLVLNLTLKASLLGKQLDLGILRALLLPVLI